MHMHKVSRLKWYLFEENIERFEEYGYPHFRYTLINYLIRSTSNYKKSKLTNKFFWAFTDFKRKIILKKNAPSILLYLSPRKYFNIFYESCKIKNLYCVDFFYSNIYNICRNIFYVPIFNILADLYSGILRDNENMVIQSLDNLYKVLQKINPDMIVLDNDSLPDARAVILVAKKLGVPTVEIQHGIYKSNSILPTGRCVDYVFVWGEYFKRLYLKQKIRPSKTIKVLGYPYELKPLPQESNKRKLTIYYLGQNFELYNRELLNIKVDTIAALNEICKKLGFEFVYRPHPGDPRGLLQKRLSNVNFAPKNETLEASFRRGDIFISFNSTSLVEAALRGKLCIQLKNFPVPTDDFEKLEICPKSVETTEELEDYLREIAKVRDPSQFHKPVSPEYIEIPKPNPGVKFLELVEDII